MLGGTARAGGSSPGEVPAPEGVRRGSRTDERLRSRGPGSERPSVERFAVERFDPARSEQRVRVRSAEERASLARIGRLRARLGRRAGEPEAQPLSSHGLGQRLRQRLGGRPAGDEQLDPRGRGDSGRLRVRLRERLRVRERLRLRLRLRERLRGRRRAGDAHGEYDPAGRPVGSRLERSFRRLNDTVRRSAHEYLPDHRATIDLSASSLTMVGARGLTTARALGRELRPIGMVSGVAGVALAASSAVELSRARTPVERAEAIHGIAWGLQSMSVLGKHVLQGARWIDPAAEVLGVSGGVLQTGVGLYRLGDGLRTKNRRHIVIGTLDSAAGVAWAVSSVSANPVALGAYVGLTAIRLAYTNGPVLKAAGGRALRAGRRGLVGLGRAGMKAARRLGAVRKPLGRLADRVREGARVLWRPAEAPDPSTARGAARAEQ